MSLKEHHSHSSRTLHLQRFSWFSFMISGLLIVQVIANMQAARAQDVLAYATNINRTDLHSLTNQNRAAAGLAGLSLNGQLNSAAQAKAEHMIANNYWSHVAPDGTTPWFFIDQSGYAYSNAGENLAYGFQTSAGVMNGWMNSPGHKANVLGNYVDVGFGIANGANYQGGENTVVVAMYATPASQPAPQPAPTPTPITPQPTQPAAPTAPQALPAPEPASPVAEPAPAAASPLATPTADTDASKEEVPATPAALRSAPSEEKRITTLQSALASEESWPLYASLAVIIISAIGFSVTHLQLMKLNIDRGIRFAYAHPAFDAAALASVSLFVLSATVGFVR